VAANKRSIKFYDFIDKSEKEAKDNQKKELENKNKVMKEIFQSIDTENAWKLDRQGLMNYFQLLNSKMGS
jgi:hypothetical protein